MKKFIVLGLLTVFVFWFSVIEISSQTAKSVMSVSKLKKKTKVSKRNIKKELVSTCGRPISVIALDLSKKEIFLNEATTQEQTVNVITTTVDVANLVFAYTVTGGKIIGTGANVSWDLSGVKIGTYSITAAVDDGCGFCGMTQTKIVTVKECPDCH